MADIPTLEPAGSVALADEVARPKKRSWLMTSIVMLVLVGGGAAGAWYFVGTKTDKAAATERAAPAGPALYVALDPPFVTNFETDQAVRFLQITVQVMSHDAATVDLVKANDPVIRNDLLLLFGNQKYTDIATRDGKERLRAQALEAVRRVISANGGKPDRVQAVYFTSFVMQ